MGKERIVMVDDKFPAISNDDRRSLFCKLYEDEETKQTEFWPLLFEKAYAKLHNGYDAIDGGRPEQAFVDLTNGIADYIDFTSDDFKEMYDDGSFWN